VNERNDALRELLERHEEALRELTTRLRETSSRPG
jgi:hypothetical protein